MSWSISPWPALEAGQQLLIAKKQSAAEDDWWCPDAASRSSLFGLLRDTEAARLFPTLGAGLDEDRRAVAFVAAVQATVSASDGTGLRFLSLRPNELPRRKVLAEPTVIFPEAEVMLTKPHDFAVMV